MAKGRHNRKRSSTSTLVLSMLLMLTVVLLLLLALGILSLPASSDHLRPAHDLSNFGRKVLERGKGVGQRDEQWVEILSWEPRAFLYHNFLSKEECEYLIDLAKPHMVKSTVVDSKTGKSKDSRVRTSSGMFLRRGQDKIIRDIEKRIADFTFIPVEHGEGLQILHYEEGQKYEPHYDYFLDEFNTKNGGQRIATVLMYLSDVEEGGETVFPASRGNFSTIPGWNERSECAKRGLSVKPVRGDALLFWSMRPDATLDPTSLHDVGSMSSSRLSLLQSLLTRTSLMLAYDILQVAAQSSKETSGHQQNGCILRNTGSRRSIEVIGVSEF